MTKEEPKKIFQKVNLSITGNKKLAVMIIAGLGLLVILLFSMQKPSKKQVPVADQTMQEQKTVYSKAEIESSIKEQLFTEKEKQENENPRVKSQEPKRKLDTKIAVYIKEEGKQDGRTNGRGKENREFGVSTGIKIKAYLANAIFSFNVTSPVIAVTDEDISKGGNVVIPKGTQFIGEAGIVQSSDRVNVKFATMVLPGGREVRIRAMALSLDGSGGVKGKVDKQYNRSILKATGEILLSGASLALGTANRPITLADELRLNASQNLANDAQGALSNVKVEQSISVEAYTPILVLLLQAV